MSSMTKRRRCGGSSAALGARKEKDCFCPIDANPLLISETRIRSPAQNDSILPFNSMSFSLS